MRRICLFLLLAFTGLVCADAGGDIADDINKVICLFVRLIWFVTGSLMALVIIFAGVKWLVSGEDAGTRASAKTFIISAFVGLILIFTAVPVVDYLVGGILGYEFGCGFFPEVDFPGSVLNVRDDSSGEPVSRDSSLGGEEPDLYVLAAGFSEEKVTIHSVDGSSPDSDTVPFCIDVGEQGGHTSAADVDVAVYLDKEGALELKEVCRETIPLVERGGYEQIACLVDREDAALVKAGRGKLNVWIDPEDKVLEVAGGKGNNNVERSGDGPDTGLRCGPKLQVQSVGDCSGLLNAQAKFKVGGEWGDYSKEITVTEETEMVALYAEFRGQAESFTWDLSWDYSGDKDNKQMFGLYPEDLPTEPGEYSATITVKTATETCSGTIEITVPSSGEEITPTKTCGELGGSCACPEGQECLNENKVAGSSDCLDTCCQCTLTESVENGLPEAVEDVPAVEEALDWEISSVILRAKDAQVIPEGSEVSSGFDVLVYLAGAGVSEAEVSLSLMNEDGSSISDLGGASLEGPSSSWGYLFIVSVDDSVVGSLSGGSYLVRASVSLGGSVKEKDSPHFVVSGNDASRDLPVFLSGQPERVEVDSRNEAEIPFKVSSAYGSCSRCFVHLFLLAREGDVDCSSYDMNDERWTFAAGNQVRGGFDFDMSLVVPSYLIDSEGSYCYRIHADVCTGDGNILGVDCVIHSNFIYGVLEVNQATEPKPTYWVSSRDFGLMLGETFPVEISYKCSTECEYHGFIRSPRSPEKLELDSRTLAPGEGTFSLPVGSSDYVAGDYNLISELWVGGSQKYSEEKHFRIHDKYPPIETELKLRVTKTMCKKVFVYVDSYLRSRVEDLRICDYLKECTVQWSEGEDFEVFQGKKEDPGCDEGQYSSSGGGYYKVDRRYSDLEHTYTVPGTHTITVRCSSVGGSTVEQTTNVVIPEQNTLDINIFNVDRSQAGIWVTFGAQLTCYPGGDLEFYLEGPLPEGRSWDDLTLEELNREHLGTQSSEYDGLVEFYWFVDFNRPLGTYRYGIQDIEYGEENGERVRKGPRGDMVYDEFVIEAPAPSSGPTILFVPVTWQGDLSVFSSIVEEHRKFLVDVYPFKNCSEKLKVKIYPEVCLPGASLKSLDECDSIAPQILSCAESYGEPYDYVLGMTNFEGACEGVSTSYRSLQTVLVAGQLRADTTAHEMGHQWGLNDEYFDKCRCYPEANSGGHNCLDASIGGSDPDTESAYSSEFCADGSKCQWDIFGITSSCLGNMALNGESRCIMGGLTGFRTGFCKYCWAHLSSLDFLTCDAGAEPGSGGEDYGGS